MTAGPSRVGALVLSLLAALACGCGRGQPEPVPEGKPPPPSRVTKENFDQVRVGMTVEEVEAILGPGQDRGIASDAVLRGVEKQLNLPADTKWKRWRDPMSRRANFVAVGFSGGKAVAKTSMGL